MEILYKWLNIVFEASHNRIKNKINRNMEEFNKRGILVSSIACNGSIKIGFESLYEEVEMILKDASKLKENTETHWDTIYKECTDFIKKESKFITNYWTERCNNTDITPSGEKIKFKESVIYANLELYIEMQKQNIRYEIKVKRWDLFKMLGSAIAGAMLTGLINKLL